MKMKIYDWLTTPHVWNTRTFNINIHLLIAWFFATGTVVVSLYALNSDTLLNTPMRHIHPILNLLLFVNLCTQWLITWSTGLVFGLTFAFNFRVVKPQQNATSFVQYMYSFFETVNHASILQLVTDVVETDQA